MAIEGHKSDSVVSRMVGEWLAKARRSAGLTQLQAAALSGVHFGVVSRCEQGRDLMTSSFLRLVWLYGAEASLTVLLEDISARVRPPTSRVAERSPRGYRLPLGGTDPIPVPRPAGSGSEAGAAAPRAGEKKRSRKTG